MPSLLEQLNSEYSNSNKVPSQETNIAPETISEVQTDLSSPQKTTQRTGNAIIDALQSENIEPATKQALGSQIRDVAQEQTGILHNLILGAGTGILSTARGTSNLFNKISEYIPGTVKKTISSVPFLQPAVLAAQAVAKISPTMSKLEEKVGTEEGKLTETPETTAGKVGYYGEKVAEIAPALVGGGVALFKGLSKVGSKFLAKQAGKMSLKEVLAIPEEEVFKLNTVDRQKWFQNVSNFIKEQGGKMSQKAKDLLLKQGDEITEETQKLQRELAVASRDKVIELRPKIIKAMGKQSKTYRNLVDEAMAGKEEVIVKTDDLKSFIDARFAEDPIKAANIKLKLGLTEQVNPLSTKTFGQNVPTKLKSETTLGDIYSQTKGLKQDFSAGKVFTSEDKLTDDAIHTLSSYMKNQGVDLAEANSFWAKYAPVRDQLVNEAKPFLQSGTQTKGLASTITRVAKKSDVNNENFISEVEKLVGEPITKEAKQIVSKMDKIKKLELAQKIEEETAQLEIKMATEKSLKNLSEKEFAIEKLAKKKELINKLIKGVLSTAGAGAAGAFGYELIRD